MGDGFLRADRAGFGAAVTRTDAQIFDAVFAPREQRSALEFLWRATRSGTSCDSCAL
jgi:hypothetical protein